MQRDFRCQRTAAQPRHGSVSALQARREANMKQGLRAFLLLGLSTLLHTTRNEQSVSFKLGKRGQSKGRMVNLLFDPSEWPQISSTSDRNIANMSLSPWTYRESSVPSRFPQVIFNAQCLTSGCLNGGKEDIGLVAKPIYYQVLVLHRQREKGGKNPSKQYEFKLGTEVVTVGCTCVRPTVIPQQ